MPGNYIQDSWKLFDLTTIRNGQTYIQVKIQLNLKKKREPHKQSCSNGQKRATYISTNCKLHSNGQCVPEEWIEVTWPTNQAFKSHVDMQILCILAIIQRGQSKNIGSKL